MYTCFDIIANAVRAWENRAKYIYFYGAKGYRLDHVTMQNLILTEPDYFKKYTPEQLEEFKEKSLYKTRIDCSGFINLVTGQYNYSTGYITEAVNVTTPDKGTWGNILYTTFGGTGRHIGLDIGAGRFLHIGSMGKTIELGLIKEFPWEKSGQLRNVDYTLTSDK